MSGFVKHGKASIVIDGQFGSTGKGLAAASQFFNSRNVDWRNTVFTTNAAPNAGHTTVLPDGRKFVTFHMPTMGVLAEHGTIYLNAGAIIDLDVLGEEVKTLGVNPDRILVHPNAAIITDEDKEYEKNASNGVTAIASTQKGVGRALARKVMREGSVAKDFASVISNMRMDVGTIDLNDSMRGGSAVVIETPQGMSLSLNNGFYPHCTSREVSVSQSLSDAGVHPHHLHNTMMVIRTFPIRVGNITDNDGNVVGYSGDGYYDQYEMSWEKDFPHVIPERTTVTKRVRRIFSFSQEQYKDSVSRLRPDIVHIGFCDYFENRQQFADMLAEMRAINRYVGVYPELFCAFGPRVNDVVPVNAAWERLK